MSDISVQIHVLAFTERVYSCLNQIINAQYLYSKSSFSTHTRNLRLLRIYINNRI